MFSVDPVVAMGGGGGIGQSFPHEQILTSHKPAARRRSTCHPLHKNASTEGSVGVGTETSLCSFSSTTPPLVSFSHSASGPSPPLQEEEKERSKKTLGTHTPLLAERVVGAAGKDDPHTFYMKYLRSGEVGRWIEEEDSLYAPMRNASVNAKDNSPRVFFSPLPTSLSVPGSFSSTRAVVLPPPSLVSPDDRIKSGVAEGGGLTPSPLLPLHSLIFSSDHLSNSNSSSLFSFPSPSGCSLKRQHCSLEETLITTTSSSGNRNRTLINTAPILAGTITPTPRNFANASFSQGNSPRAFDSKFFS